MAEPDRGQPYNSNPHNMILKKSIVSNINRKLISKLKDLIIIHYGHNKQINREFIICEEHVYGKRKIRFLLVYNQSDNKDYTIKGEYCLSKGISYITIYFTNGNKFDFTDFSKLYFEIKGILYHEIEHHLQRLQVPFREKLKSLDCNTIEYVYSPSELEAYLKELYFLSKKTNKNLSALIDSTSNIFDEGFREIFINNMRSYIKKRKDLNISI